MATRAAIVKRRTTDSIGQLASDNSSMQLEPGQWGFAAADQTLVIRDLEGSFYHIKTESAILDSILVKEPVQTAAVLPSGDRVGTLRMVLDGNSYWFKTESNWVQMPDIEWIREEIGYIEENARQIDASDNGNGSFTFTNYYGEEKVIQTGKRVQSADSTVSVEENADNFDLSIQPALDEVYTELEAEITRAKQAEQGLQGQIDIANARMERIENLGDYAGAFDTYASLPKNTSGFSQTITVNDFVTIRNDETRGNATTRYVVSDIANNSIAWTYDITYSMDISGKVDKATNLDGADFNSVTTTGVYKITNSSTNAPTGSGTSSLLAVFGNGVNVIQMCRYYHNNSALGDRVAMRSRDNGGAWTGWQYIAIQSDLTAIATDVSGKVSKVGDTMSGELKAPKITGTNNKLEIGSSNEDGNLWLKGNLSVTDVGGTERLVVENDDYSWRGRIQPTLSSSSLSGFLKRDPSGNTSIDTSAYATADGDPNRVMMANGSHSTGYMDFLGSLSGVYSNVTSIGGIIGYFVILSSNKLEGIIISGNPCNKIAYCTIKRSNTSENFSIDKPWEWPSSRISNLEEKIGKTLDSSQVDNPNSFPVGISFWFVPSYRYNNDSYTNSLLTVIRRDDGMCRQTLTPMVFSSPGGGGYNNRIYSRSGAISSSLAWAAVS